MNLLADNFKKILLLIVDFLLMFFSLWLALVIRHGSNYTFNLWDQHWQSFIILYIFWGIIFYSFNLYNTRANLYITALLTNLLRATFVNFLISIIYFYLAAPDSNISPKTVLAINITIFTFIAFFWRRLFITLSTTSNLQKNILIIGWDDVITEMIEELPSYGYNIKTIFTDEKDFVKNLPIYRLNDLEKLPEIIRKEKIQLIVLTNTIEHQIINQLFLMLRLRINFINLTKFYEQVFSKVPLESINQSWFLENLSEGNKGFFEFLKRIFDILFALTFSIISLPFIPFIMLLVKLNSTGPIFFTQVRTGKDGREFKAIKFRSMYVNSENKGPMYAQENDPRVTKIGKFLRKTRVDEIPQLFNILKGEMSFIGPRPERPEFIKDLEVSLPFYRERLLVKPGLTGWAQINFPYAATIEENLKKLQYDLYYIKNRSLTLDLSILLKTLNIIIKGAGR